MQQQYDPAINFLSEHYLFSLGATALERTNLKTGSHIQKNYADIFAVRLDYQSESEEGLRRQHSTRTYTCTINDLYDIKSAIQNSDFFWSYGKDLKYNVFITNLHQKLIAHPNQNRIYSTNFAETDYKVILYASLGFMLTCSIWFFILLQSLNFQMPYHYIIGIILIYIIGFVCLWQSKPKNYTPDDLPTRFLC